MANSKVLIEVIATAKGLKVVAKDTEALVKSTEKLEKEQKKSKKSTDAITQSHAKYDKQNKSVFQGNLSASKGFSKMKETIGGGSSGLVQAYATLAANVFAATAAFTALRQASQVDTLVKALDALGTAAGQNLGALGEAIRDAAGEAISLDQALRTASIGASAGFDTSQIKGLAEVGRLAAISLGRDVGDAVDRLTRGAAKLEPEILDELGIFVRLDDAAAKYAATLGVSASSLSRFEKRQAFANEILEQGRFKFSEVANIEPSSFDKLAATFADLSRNLMSFVNTVLDPIAGFFADNAIALAAFGAMITKGVIQTALPALSKYGDTARQIAANSLGLSQASLVTTEKDIAANAKKMDSLKIVRGGQAQLLEDYKSGARGVDALEEREKMLTASVKRRQANIDSGQTKNVAKSKKNIKLIDIEIAKVKEQIRLEEKKQRLQSGTGSKAASAAFSASESKIFEQLDLDSQEGNFVEGYKKAFKEANKTTRQFGKDMRANTKDVKIFGLTVGGKGLLGRALTSGKIAFKGFGLTGRIAIKGLFTAIPFIGQILFALDLLVNALRGAIGFLAGMRGETSDLTKANRQFAGAQETFNKTQKTSLLLIDDENEKRKTILKNKIAQGQAQKTLQDTAEDAAKQQRKAFEEQSLFGKILTRQLQRMQFGLMILNNAFGSLGRASKSFFISASIGFKEFMMGIKEGIANLFTGDGVGASAARKIFGIEDPETMFNFTKDRAEIQQLKADLENLDIEKAFSFTTMGLGMLGSEVGLSKPFLALRQTLIATTDSGEEFRQKLGQTTPDMLAFAIATGDTSNLTDDFDSSLKAILDSMDANNDGFISAEEKINAVSKITKTATADSTAFSDALQRQADIFKESEQKAAEFVTGLKSTNKELALAGELTNLMNTIRDSDGNVLVGDQDNEQAIAFVENLKKMGTGMRRLVTGGGSLEEFEAKLKELEDSPEKIVEEFDKQVQAARDLVKTIGILTLAEKSRLGTLKRQEAIFKSQSKISKTAVEEEIRLRNSQADVVDERLSAQIKQQRKILGFAEDEVITFERIKGMKGEELEFALKLLELQEQQNANDATRLNNKHQLAMLEEVALNSAKQAFELSKAQEATAVKRFAAETKLANLALGKGGKLSEADKIKAAERAANFAIKSAQTELKLLESKLKIERLLLEAKFIAEGISMEEGSRAQQLLKELDAQHQIQKQITAEKITQATLDQKVVNIDKFEGLLGGTSGNQLLSAIGTAGTLSGRKDVFDEEGNITGQRDATTQEKLEALSDATQPLRDELMKLGPEGELVATAQQGVLTMAAAFDVLMTSTDKADKLAAVGAAIGAVSQIMAANSKAQIAEIDKQIEAEKRRDGKSESSLRKIKDMEKKKEAMQKKAFEQNKKMQMAQTVINTASGIMRAYKDFDGLTATALAVMIGALGAAQLAIISKQQFQGASSGDIQKPSTSLSIGKRSNAVDVSQSATAGELNFLRGGRTAGTNLGGAGASFPGSAMGRKGYAMGFRRGYADGGVVVGERGPEVITPSSDVDIVPNFALGGGETNVNFSINAIDAAGVEDVLTNQRGNIIRMIREAANENGERFLETIDTQTYGSNT